MEPGRQCGGRERVGLGGRVGREGATEGTREGDSE